MHMKEKHNDERKTQIKKIILHSDMKQQAHGTYSLRNGNMRHEVAGAFISGGKNNISDIEFYYNHRKKRERHEYF